MIFRNICSYHLKAIIFHRIKYRSYLKNASNAQKRRCQSPQNSHILPCMLRFFVGWRFALERDLLFLRWLLVKIPIKWIYSRPILI